MRTTHTTGLLQSLLLLVIRNFNCPLLKGTTNTLSSCYQPEKMPEVRFSHWFLIDHAMAPPDADDFLHGVAFSANCFICLMVISCTIQPLGKQPVKHW